MPVDGEGVDDERWLLIVSVTRDERRFFQAEELPVNFPD
jgi:hypothetical protein